MHSTLSPYFSTLFSHFFFTIFNHKMGNWKPWSSIRQYLLSSEKTWKYLHCNLFPIRHLSVHFCLEYIICEVSPSGVDLCWLILIDADWFWLMLIDSGWCWCWCWCCVPREFTLQRVPLSPPTVILHFMYHRYQCICCFWFQAVLRQFSKFPCHSLTFTIYPLHFHHN